MQAGFCEPGFDCLDGSGNFAPSWDPDTCMYTTDCCAELPALSVGFVGQHSEVAVTDDGTIWVSGYSAGLTDRYSYGDLVVGTWDAPAREMDWEHVDGVPATRRDRRTLHSAADVHRGDVGKYSIAVGADGNRASPTST